MAYLDHQELLARAKSKPPEDPKNTVSSFSTWVFGLYMQSSYASMQHGKATEFEIERAAQLRRFGIQPPPMSPSYELEFTDPLDGSSKGFQISSLILNGKPMIGLPDVVFRKKLTGEVIIFERKATSSRPDEWPNLKVQLWCYGRIDKWKSAPNGKLLGSIYDPKYNLQHSEPVGDW